MSVDGKILVGIVVIFNQDLKQKHTIKSKFTIGRSKTCDLPFPDNKLLSSTHGFIDFDKENKLFYYHDTSSNGSVVNLKDKLHNAEHQLNIKDLVFLVYRDNESQKNIYFEVVEFIYEVHESKPNEAKAQKREYIVISDSEDEPAKKSIKDTKELNKSVEEIEASNTAETKPCTSKEADKRAKENEQKKDDYGDALACSICQEIMHDCVSLQPCNHSYCAGCYSEWMEKSDKCPICRDEVTRITRNPIIREVIEIYLKANPGKQRSKEEIDRLNNANKITNDMLYPKKERLHLFADSEFMYMDGELGFFNHEEYDSEEYDDDAEEHFFSETVEEFLFEHLRRPARIICRQCSGAVDTELIEPQPQPRVNQQQYPNFHCPQNQNHVLCQCCLKPMPDRANHLANRTLLTPQSCYVCNTSYCHMYWGCRKIGCRGCLNKFEDFEFEEIIKDDLINRNNFETQVLTEWLEKYNKSDRDFFAECVRKLKNGVFRTNVINGENPHEKAVCQTCAYKVLAELAYQYRASIPRAQLPLEITNRTNCHWGKNCRTQSHNADHARRYNHICEQTRWE